MVDTSQPELLVLEVVALVETVLYESLGDWAGQTHPVFNYAPTSRWLIAGVKYMHKTR